MEGDDYRDDKGDEKREFQSTLSHGGRHTAIMQIETVPIVSIHALAWRATGNIDVGTHDVNCFNPRPRTEGDARPDFAVIDADVSIHALARRATPRLVEGG